MLTEAVRSRAWSIAKQVALDEWNKGSADTTQMLIAVSRAVDAVLADLLATGAERYFAGAERYFAEQLKDPNYRAAYEQATERLGDEGVTTE